VVTAKDIGWTGGATGTQKFWQAGANPRGYTAENYMVRISQPGTKKLPYGFKTFDIAHGTENAIKAISVKTLDTMTPARVANPRQVFYTINKHVRDMMNFTIDRRRDTLTGEVVRIARDNIASRELQLAIPTNSSPAAMREVTNAIEKAVFENEDLFVKVIKIAD
jgi:filamentous hemagglutinin